MVGALVTEFFYPVEYFWASEKDGYFLIFWQPLKIYPIIPTKMSL